MHASINSKLEHLAEELSNLNLALFVGAGLSIEAGLPSWRDLIEPLATDLQVPVTAETDLLAIAQYHVNENGSNRGKINDLVKSKFMKPIEPTRVHRLLAGLPISVLWTTNYDQLLERALQAQNKIYDVKSHTDNFASRVSNASVTVYKMHGDASSPERAVLTKEDYERYHVRQTQFLESLRSDLAQRTFLFLGFSFSDYNVDYVLGRLRSLLTGNQRQHYCIFAELTQCADEAEADFNARKRLHELFLRDLLRYGVSTILVQSHAQIYEVLVKLKAKYEVKGDRPGIKRTMAALYETISQQEDGRSKQEGFDGELITVIKAPAKGTIYHSVRRDGAVVDEPLAAPGKHVQRGEPLFLMDINQTRVEIVSPVAGEVVEILIRDDSRIKAPGQAICLIRRSSGQKIPSRYHVARAPYDCTFYVSDDPDRAPMAAMGQSVNSDTPICVLEVQKTYRTVTPGIAGVVRLVNFPNQTAVEEGDCLFIVALHAKDFAGASKPPPSRSGLPFKVQVAPVAGLLHLGRSDGSHEVRPGQRVVAGETIANLVQDERITPIVVEHTGYLLYFYRAENDFVKQRDAVFAFVSEQTVAAARKHFTIQKSERSGHFSSAVSFGHSVSKGELIGRVGDYEICAAQSGDVLWINEAKTVDVDDVIFKFSAAKP